ncbi:MAG: chemotaxis protein [Defluviitaleaceae bacterium]|nr:chemotaxis protein [Defluviitaleaceae bacterium]
MLDNKKPDILLESGTNELGVMEFTISNQHFGINVAKVLEIIRYGLYPITPMPNSNPFVEGVFNNRGEIMTVVNLAAYMGLPPSENDERDILIVTKFNKIQTAFHVHNVKEINRISWTAIEKPDKAIYGGEEGLATGIAHCDDRLITIIDFEKILTDINPSSGIKISDVDRFGDRDKTTKPVLIAEDSPLLERMILESLEKAGYINVVCCANGKEAWDALMSYKGSGLPIEEQCSIIITDIEMPQMDGHRLLKLIRDDEVLTVLPVIVFSSLITEEMRAKGEKLGATEQLSKPEIADLVTMIDRHIL